MKTAVSSVARGEESPSVAQSTIQWDRIGVFAMALIVATCAIVWAFFCDHPQDFDDIGLFNVPYMYSHYGILSYPAHGEFQALTVHPPIHYWLIGLQMKLGIPPFYAEAIPLLVIILLGIFLILRSEFPSPVKAGLLLAFCMPFLFVKFIPTMRPDTHRGLALFTGLVALESGRLQHWKTGRLFLGSFLVTYASALHYPGFAGFLGVFVYIVWVFMRQGIGWKRPVIALLAGGCAIGIPYLVLFVIPHRHDILAAVSGVGPLGGMSSSLRIHLQVYREFFWGPKFWQGLSDALATRLFFFPVALGIPLIVISTASLLVSRATRGLALASLPYPMFLLFLMTHKLYWMGYFLPEFMLYVAGIGILVGLGLSRLCNRLLPERQSSMVWSCACIGSTLALLSVSPSLRNARIALQPRLHETEIARAAGRAILGPDALVGSRNAIMFYASGAGYYYDVSPDLLWKGSLPPDLNEYFKPFDAIVEHQAFSSSTENNERKSLVSWYVDGTLNLRGFYLSSENAALPYLMLNTSPARQIDGFASLKGNQVAHFREQSDGDYTFVAAVCNQNSRPAVPNLFINAYLLPAQVDATPPKELVTWLVKDKDYKASRGPVSVDCKIRDEIPLGMERLDTRQFLATLNNDQPIRFFEHLEDALDARYGPPIEFRVRADGWLNTVEFHRGQHEGESYSFSGREAHELLRSEMNSTVGWQINRYGQAGGLKILPDGLGKGDASADYSSGDTRDHLSSPFLTEPLKAGLLFFSVWVKPLGKSALPDVYVQNATYVSLGHASPAVTRSDGWILLAGWAEASRREQIRLVVVEPPGTATLLDRALVVESATHSLPQRMGQNPERRMPRN
jgi:hypothetical protein